MNPHITLLAPDRPALPPSEARAAFQSLDLSTQPFRISAHNLHRFSRRSRHTIVLVPENPDPLIRLFNTLIGGCTWQDTAASTRRSYQPHITLVNQISDQQLETVERHLQHLHPSADFECTSLILYAKQTRWPAWQDLGHHLLTRKD